MEKLVKFITKSGPVFIKEVVKEKFIHSPTKIVRFIGKNGSIVKELRLNRSTRRRLKIK